MDVGFSDFFPCHNVISFLALNKSERFIKSSYQYLSNELSSGQLHKDFNCEQLCQPVPEQFQDPLD